MITTLLSDVMQTDPISVQMDTPLSQVRLLIEEHGFHHIPVLEEDELVGIISDRDIFRVLSPFLGTAAELTRDLALLDKVAHQVMTRQPISLSVNDPLEKAIDWMLKGDISCLPVLNKGRLVGIITWRDLIALLK